ncbi:uncharacterized protein LOC134062292 [Sardina pilchardus]|uniref:uncharacterized protein LOC134062292 n=1 Tax=Sardina pilchardus TaxID=27697 RepID=UPI002E12C0B8
MKQQVLTLLLLTVHFCSSENQYSTLGGSVTFSPGRDQIRSIVWKFGNDKVAEYDPIFEQDVAYYGDFKERTTLDINSGNITITTLTEKLKGTYSVEVNNEVLGTKFVIELVPKVIIEKKIILISSDGVTCKLNCTAKPSSIEYPLEYKWIPNGQPSEETNILIVNKDEWSKSFTCIASNQGSRDEAAVTAKDLCEGSDLTVPVAVGTSFGIVCLLAPIALYLKKRAKTGNPTSDSSASTTATYSKAPSGTDNDKD